MSKNLVKAAISLALTSAVLTIIMFLLDAPIAGVFELSVCAGLITVIFVSTISLTVPRNKEEALKEGNTIFKRFIWLIPILAVLFYMVISFYPTNFNLNIVSFSQEMDMKNILWNERQFDVLGQIVIILTGVFAVVVLFKEAKNK
jgi:NADH-quinone oxidoreductase subunit J